MRKQALLICGALLVGALQIQAQNAALPFTCEIFSATTSAAALAERFGPGSVTTGQVPWGGAEGDFNEGSVLFGSSTDARVEIYWRDAANKRNPQWVSVKGTSTRWQTSSGITLGTTLQRIEQLNRRPFRLLGFGHDASGTVMSWSGGRLEGQDSSSCRIRVRVGPDWGHLSPAMSRQVNQLKGAEYSSGHPAMQGLNPTVYEMLIQYNANR